ncbi:MAG: hypothetical protein RLZZ159_1178 [Actinomycetota bacterium]|jgi:hypothetical protein
MSITGLLEKWQIPKSRFIFHIVFALITAGFWILPAILIEIFVASDRENEAWESKRQIQEQIIDTEIKIEDKKEIIQDLIMTKAKVEESLSTSFKTPFELPVVWLWESRESVTSVTSGTTRGKTRTGTVGLGWSDGIGWAASQGVTRGTIDTQTTEIINNEYRMIDTGKLRIGSEFVAFVGDQFTRTGFYKDILAFNTDYGKGIGFSVLNAERIWLTRFPGEFEKEIALALIDYAHSKAVKGKSANTTDLLDKFDDHISELQKEIQDLESTLNQIDASSERAE